MVVAKPYAIPKNAFMVVKITETCFQISKLLPARATHVAYTYAYVQFKKKTYILSYGLQVKHNKIFIIQRRVVLVLCLFYIHNGNAVGLNLVLMYYDKVAIILHTILVSANYTK